MKYIHQDWLRAAQTSVSLDVDARPGVLPAARHHPASLPPDANRDASAEANIPAEEIFRMGCLAGREGVSGCGKG